MYNSIINIKLKKDPSDVATRLLSLPALAGQLGENWFHAYIKVQYHFKARNNFALLKSSLSKEEIVLYLMNLPWAVIGFAGRETERKINL